MAPSSLNNLVTQGAIDELYRASLMEYQADSQIATYTPREALNALRGKLIKVDQLGIRRQRCVEAVELDAIEDYHRALEALLKTGDASVARIPLRACELANRVTAARFAYEQYQLSTPATQEAKL